MKIKALIVFLVSSLVAQTLFLNVAIAATAFTDVGSDNVNIQAIKYLQDANIVQGYGDGTYKPESKISRADFLKIAMEAAGIKPEGQNCFTDVKTDWYAGYVCAASKAGLVQGFGDGSFKPNQKISFIEAAKIVVKALGVAIPTNDNENWYQQYVAALEARNAIPTDIATFDYDITRGQMAEIVWRVQTKQDYVQSIGYTAMKRRSVAAISGDKFQNFTSCMDLRNYLGENPAHPIMYEKVMTGAPAPTTAMPSSAPSAAAPAADTSGNASADYSTTNLQVQGVDEADIVKNDGQYIYIVKGDTVRVVDANPPTSMKELDSVTFGDKNFTPSDMYVDANRLVVIGNTYDSLWDKTYVNEPLRPNTYMPVRDGYYYGGVMKMYIFDISDRTKIQEIRNVQYEGSYSSSRKVGKMVYLVINKPEYAYTVPENWNEHDIVPLYKDSNATAVDSVTTCSNILYLPGSTSTNYMVVAGVPVDDAKGKLLSEVVIGSSGDVFASTSNLYVAEQKYSWFFFAGNDKEETTVHKFSLSAEAIKYLGKADVPGHIINQFSMDEDKGNFRIATTLGSLWDAANPSTSGIYVLDENLKQIGSVTGIAPGEELYSSRFAGNRAYLVTFKKTDPFFVIDLSDATNPKIMGKLSIPGFSDYLEPYDDNHIIGFGKDAVDASEQDMGQRGLNFAWYQGLKLALFDVTDVTNPVEMFNTVIGDRGTTSPVLYDHKALLFDKNKGLLALPLTVAEISQTLKNDPKTDPATYGNIVFQGAYVYNISLDKGFDLKGKITHYAPTEVQDKSGYYWYGASDIQRILYIGQYLYTVSQAMVKANNLGDLTEVNSLKLAQ